jgi:hypothetical protein
MQGQKLTLRLGWRSSRFMIGYSKAPPRPPDEDTRSSVPLFLRSVR